MVLRTITSLCLLAGTALTSVAAHAADADLLKRGEYLARAGDCVACHTAPGGKPFAGGLIMETPFGKIATPNITPDKETGIGTWTDDQFYRAMHEGLDDEGKNLYPVFPFPWYTKVTRDDVMAIKAYIFAQPAVHAPRKPVHFAFPFDIREGLDAWRLAFFHAATFAPDPKQSNKINRGAYLVQGLGHCSECHSENNLFGSSALSKPLQGGEIEGWYAPNISSDIRQGIGTWSEDEIATFLKTGSVPGKGLVLGPMQETIQDSLAYLSDDDLHAIAAYLKSTPPVSHEAPQDGTASNASGAVRDSAYLTFCASCHQVNGHGVPGVVPALAGNGAVNAGGPQDVIRVVLGGLQARETYAPMPALGADMTPDQIAEAVNYVRTAWGNTAPANAGPGMVADLAKQTDISLSGPTGECLMPAIPTGAQKVDVTTADVPTLMQGINDSNMLDQVAQIVARVRAATPNAKPADLVNSLSAAYCPIVLHADNVTLTDKRHRLQRFAQLVYSQIARPDQSAQQQ